MFFLCYIDVNDFESHRSGDLRKLETLASIIRKAKLTTIIIYIYLNQGLINTVIHLHVTNHLQFSAVLSIWAITSSDAWNLDSVKGLYQRDLAEFLTEGGPNR